MTSTTGTTERTCPAIEERGDELVVRRPDWMTDQQWATVAAGLRDRRWESGAAGCPTWCADHRLTESSIPADVMNEHRSRVLTSDAAAHHGGSEDAGQPATVWVEQAVWPDSDEEATVVTKLPCDQELTSLTPAQARDLADSLLEAADLLDGLGRTHSVHGAECDR